jgi:MFS family permease
MTATPSTAGASRREWVGLAVLGVPTFLVAMDFSVLYLAVPHLTGDLAPSGIQQLWIVDIYGFLLAGSLVVLGSVGDRIGRKKLLLIGGAVFGLASVAAAFSRTPEMLIASRALLGLPPDAADAARESVDRAVAASGLLPAAQGGDLLAAAREAFTTGLHVVGVVTAVFYAVLAVLALWAFRHMRALDPDCGPASTSSGERHDALARSDH